MAHGSVLPDLQNQLPITQTAIYELNSGVRSSMKLHIHLARSLSVTRNRRLTFRIDTAERDIYDVNLEDYH